MNKQELINKIQKHLDENEECLNNPHTDSDDEFVVSIRNTEWNKALKYAYQLDEPQKVKVPKFIADWIETAKKEKRALHYSMQDIDDACYYHKGDDPVYQWMFVCDDSSEHQEMFARAYMDGYEVEEEPKWVVKVGNLYFCGWEDTTAQFVMNTVLGEDESIIKYKNEGTASSVAKNLGGTVEKV